MEKYKKSLIRTARGSGQWFPDSRRRLEAMVHDFVESADVPIVEGRIIGAIAPHAGYVYSGQTAGHAFRAIKDNAERFGAPATVVVLGFYHRGGRRGVALMDGAAIETPLGQCPLDEEAAAFLQETGAKTLFNYAPHGDEHSAENQIPFVQTVLPGVKAVVGLLGDHDEDTLTELTASLVKLADTRRILVLASTDLLHDADYERVTRTDKETLARMVAMDHPGILKSWNYSNQVCCGIGPVMTVMRFAESRGCAGGVRLSYRNSGDDFPESRGNWVVGYGAVVFAVQERQSA